MYILFDPLIRSNSCIFICDDGHKITSSRVDRLYSPSLSLDFTFQSIFCSFSSLLIYLFGWCVCVFFFLLCRSQKYAHIKLKIDWNVCIWNNAWKKHLNFFYLSKKVFRTYINMRYPVCFFTCVMASVWAYRIRFLGIVKLRFFILRFCLFLSLCVYSHRVTVWVRWISMVIWSPVFFNGRTMTIFLYHFFTLSHLRNPSCVWILSFRT